MLRRSERRTTALNSTATDDAPDDSFVPVTAQTKAFVGELMDFGAELALEYSDHLGK